MYVQYTLYDWHIKKKIIFPRDEGNAKQTPNQYLFPTCTHTRVWCIYTRIYNIYVYKTYTLRPLYSQNKKPKPNAIGPRRSKRVVTRWYDHDRRKLFFRTKPFAATRSPRFSNSLTNLRVTPPWKNTRATAGTAHGYSGLSPATHSMDAIALFSGKIPPTTTLRLIYCTPCMTCVWVIWVHDGRTNMRCTERILCITHNTSDVEFVILWYDIFDIICRFSISLKKSKIKSLCIVRPRAVYTIQFSQLWPNSWNICFFFCINFFPTLF